MFKSAQVVLNKIALNVKNPGRPGTAVTLDTSDGGLLQSCLGGFDSANQPLILVKANAAGNEFPIEDCIAHTTEVMASIDYGMTEGETPTEKSKSVRVLQDDDKLKEYKVVPSLLHMPDKYKPTYIVLGGNHRTLTGLVAGSLQGGNYQIAQCNVYDNYADGIAAARKENGQKEVGVTPLTKLDNILMVQEGLADHTIKREVDLERKLSIASRNMRQSVFGPAVKGRLVEELQDMILKGELDCRHSKLPINKLNQKIGPKFIECNDIEQVKDMLEEFVPFGASAKNKAMSGNDIRDIAKLSVGPLKALLTAIASGDSGEAYQAMEQINIALK